MVLNPGQSQIVLSNAGSGTPYLCFASGTPHTTGATVGFSASGGQIEFLANPPPHDQRHSSLRLLWPRELHDGRFRHALHICRPDGFVSALAYSASTAGNHRVRWLPLPRRLNVAATGSKATSPVPMKFNSLKLVGPAVGHDDPAPA